MNDTDSIVALDTTKWVQPAWAVDELSEIDEPGEHNYREVGDQGLVWRSATTKVGTAEFHIDRFDSYGSYGLHVGETQMVVDGLAEGIYTGDSAAARDFAKALLAAADALDATTSEVKA